MDATTTQFFNTMLALQDSMNTRVSEQWRANNNPWYRAVWTECAEMLDHYGWKWWKQQTPDWDQIQLELVDIWHFGLSMALQNHQSQEEALEFIISSWSTPASATDPEPFRDLVDTLAQTALSDHRFNFAAFQGLLTHAGMSLTQLYRLYIGKNVLNFFRQDHGYKTGDYQKVWGGREDNEWLSEILSELDSTQPNFQEAVYDALEKAYPA